MCDCNSYTAKAIVFLSLFKTAEQQQIYEKNCHCPDNEAPERQQVQRAKMKKESRKMGVDEGRKEGKTAGMQAGRPSYLQRCSTFGQLPGNGVLDNS